jgi:hypothetical protein
MVAAGVRSKMPTTVARAASVRLPSCFGVGEPTVNSAPSGRCSALLAWADRATGMVCGATPVAFAGGTPCT